MASRVPPSLHLVRRALVRSRVKLRVLFGLLDLGEASVADLAREARASPERVRGALHGDGVAFAFATSLVRLRLVRVRPSVLGELVVLTPFGARVARAWRAESTRVALGLRRRPHA